ncbi:DUF362 domain-containing protein [bacterium]|nr:DUF362 domain-containing protein [candidate division CSSED10-310 bacterium]
MVDRTDSLLRSQLDLNPPVVVLVRCESYDFETVESAFRKAVGLLDTWETLFHKDETILLKPNLLSSRLPDAAVTTHPSVFRAVAKTLFERGVQLTYGDSPAVSTPGKAAEKAGLTEIAESLGIPMSDFMSSREMESPPGSLIKRYQIARGVVDASGMVSISKMKTHGFQTITGAVKNQFGCIPGLRKAEFHARLPDPFDFARMLVDLTRLVKPRLYVMDAVTAMEGNGPGGGEPKQMNLIMLGTDPVAIDATAAVLMGLRPEDVPVIAWGSRSGLGKFMDIQYRGEPPGAFRTDSFIVPDSGRESRHPFLASILRRYIIPKPVVDADRCISCGQCVAVCPVHPKAIHIKSAGDAPSYQYRKCIRCYCCQEACPESAIRIVMPLPGRLIHSRAGRSSDHS